MDNSTEQLSQRERMVLQAVICCDSNVAVARSLGLSQGTVKQHLRSIYQKLGVSSRTGAIALAVRMGYVALDGDLRGNLQP